MCEGKLLGMIKETHVYMTIFINEGDSISMMNDYNKKYEKIFYNFFYQNEEKVVKKYTEERDYNLLYYLLKKIIPFGEGKIILTKNKNIFMNFSNNGYFYIYPYSDVNWRKLVIEVEEDKCYKDSGEKKEMELIYKMLIKDIKNAYNKLPSLPELLWFLEINEIFENGLIGVLWRDILFDESYFYDNERRINNFLYNIIYTGIFDSESEKSKWKIFFVAFILVKIYHLTKDDKLNDIMKDFDKIKDLLKICDNALIVGYDIGKKYLSKCADFLHDMLPKPPEYREIIYGEILEPGKIINSKTIPSIYIDDEETFLLEYFLKSKPVIIKGYVDKWGAFNKWNHKFFYQSFYYRSIPVEYGESYTSSDYHSKVITFGEYLSNNNGGYLAQHDIFHQIPKLKDDIMITSLIFCDSITTQYIDVDMNIFLGKPESYSPLHQDPRHNFFCQVFLKFLYTFIISFLIIIG